MKKIISLKFIFIFSTLFNFVCANDLRTVESFGDNPGHLQMMVYSPSGIKENAPVVVVLHGCTQSARDFDDETGWIKLANDKKFHLLFPETNSSNNIQKCFNWFEPADIRRNSGEALSIANMVKWFLNNHSVNHNKVFITGLSAGGAMSAVMAATYPELFNAVGIVAGVPFGCADSVVSALLCMKGGSWFFDVGTESVNFYKEPSEWGDFVRRASNFKGKFPRVSIWHGERDSVVKAVNAGELVKQWTNIHGLDLDSYVEDTVESAKRRRFLNQRGESIVELYLIEGMEHGQAVKPGNTASSCGKAAPYILSADICTSYHLADFFNL